MNTMQKEQLTRRYLDGLTTNVEEQQLARLLADAPKPTAEERVLSVLMQNKSVAVADENWLTEDFGKEFDRLMARHRPVRSLWPWLMTAAAILIAVYLYFRPTDSSLPQAVVAEAEEPVATADDQSLTAMAQVQPLTPSEQPAKTIAAGRPSVGVALPADTPRLVQGLSDEVRSKYYVLTIVDGKEDAFPADRTDDITEVVELTPEQAVAIYGKKGCNGALIVNTTARTEKAGTSDNETDYVKEPPMLIVVNGEVVPQNYHSLEEYMPGAIVKNVTFLTSETAVRRYGESGRNGAVIYEVKPAKGEKVKK